MQCKNVANVACKILNMPHPMGAPIVDFSSSCSNFYPLLSGVNLGNFCIQLFSNYLEIIFFNKGVEIPNYPLHLIELKVKTSNLQLFFKYIMEYNFLTEYYSPNVFGRN